MVKMEVKIVYMHNEERISRKGKKKIRRSEKTEWKSRINA